MTHDSLYADMKVLAIEMVKDLKKDELMKLAVEAMRSKLYRDAIKAKKDGVTKLVTKTLGVKAKEAGFDSIEEYVDSL